MSLREDMWKYEQITGESAEHVPIIKLGAFLDGYEMGLKTLEQQPCEDCTVIKKLSKKYYVEDAYGYTDEGIVNKVNEIIDAVNKSSSTPQIEPCEDCISKESVIEWLKDKDIIKTKNQEENARRELADLPSVTPRTNLAGLHKQRKNTKSIC